MAIRKYGVHKFHTASDVYLQQIVVVENGKFSNSFPLTEEIAFAEWLGGVAILSGKESIDIQLPASFEVVLHNLLEVPGQNLWHINVTDYSLGVVHQIKRLL